VAAFTHVVANIDTTRARHRHRWTRFGRRFVTILPGMCRNLDGWSGWEVRTTYLELTVQQVGHDALVTAAGGIDPATTPELRTILCKQVSSQPRRLVLSLSRVERLDPTGLTTLVAVTKHARQYAVDFRIAAPSRHVVKVFRQTLFDEVLPIYPSVSTALGERRTRSTLRIPKQRSA
jgi:anti-sigma B factor antagonist